MISKYAVHKMNVGWVVVTKGNGHIMSAGVDTE